MLFLCLAGIPHIYAQYPVVYDKHPKIYLDSSRVADLSQCILIPGDCQETFTTFLYRYNNWWINDPELYLLGNDSTQWTWTWGSVYAKDEALFTAFLYLITGDELSLKRCRFIAGSIIDTMANVNFAVMEFYEKEDFLRRLSDAGSILLDWCYNAFPPLLRNQLALAHYKMNRQFMNSFILNNNGNSYVSSHNAWNSVFTNQNALALYHSQGLSDAMHDTVNAWYEIVYDKWINGFLPCYGYYRDDDGGWNWGAAYSLWSLMDQFQLFDNMLYSTNKNFYADLPWIQNSINQYWYYYQPDDYCIHSGDGKTKMVNDRVIYRHARLFNDPRSMWLGQHYSLPQYYSTTNAIFQKLLFKDFDLPLVDKPVLPLNWWSDKPGLSVSRSSWDDDAVMTTFFNSPSKKAAHEHRDNNAFTVFKHKPLIIDAGYYDTYGGSHYRNYYERTIAHNCVVVYDSTEVYTTGGNPVSNDGGQIQSNTLYNYNDIFLPENQKGEWIHYSAGDNYQYNIADAQLSYDHSKVDFFRRRFLFSKPSKIIVLDHLQLNAFNGQQRNAKWIAHFVRKPAINGTLINSQVPGHVETFNGTDCTSTYGKGNVSIRTLLPEYSKVTRVGGEGYQFWVDGVNYLPQSLPDTTNYHPGSWRIEVEPVTYNDSLIFLHTISVGDSIIPSVAGGTLLRSTTSIGVDWENTFYLFAADGGINKLFHSINNLSGNRNITLFATDLNPGLYFLKLNGTIIYTLSADTAGIIQIDFSLPEGFHQLQLVSTTVSTIDITASSNLIVYPNPAFRWLMLNISDNNSGSITITDLSGKVVMTHNSSKSIDISGLAEGQYILNMVTGKKILSAKFIKKSR